MPSNLFFDVRPQLLALQEISGVGQNFKDRCARIITMCVDSETLNDNLVEILLEICRLDWQIKHHSKNVSEADILHTQGILQWVTYVIGANTDPIKAYATGYATGMPNLVDDFAIDAPPSPKPMATLEKRPRLAAARSYLQNLPSYQATLKAYEDTLRSAIAEQKNMNNQVASKYLVGTLVPFDKEQFCSDKHSLTEAENIVRFFRDTYFSGNKFRVSLKERAFSTQPFTAPILMPALTAICTISLVGAVFLLGPAGLSAWWLFGLLVPAAGWKLEVGYFKGKRQQWAEKFNEGIRAAEIRCNRSSAMGLDSKSDSTGGIVAPALGMSILNRVATPHYEEKKGMEVSPPAMETAATPVEAPDVRKVRPSGGRSP